jgi:hypothetical protein
MIKDVCLKRDLKGLQPLVVTGHADTVESAVAEYRQNESYS